MENKFSLLQDKAGKMAGGGITHAVDYLVIALVVVLLLAALAPTIFGSLNNLTGAAGVPSWVPTVFIVIAAVGLLYILLRAIGIGAR